MPEPIRAPEPEFARPGANPTLESIEYLRAVLRHAEVPLGRSEIHHILAGWSHGMGRESVNAVIDFLAVDGSIGKGSRG
jgi:hypothetical protein